MMTYYKETNLQNPRQIRTESSVYRNTIHASKARQANAEESDCLFSWLLFFTGTTALGTVFLAWPANPLWSIRCIFLAECFFTSYGTKTSHNAHLQTTNNNNDLNKTKISKYTNNEDLQKDFVWKGSDLPNYWSLDTFNCFFFVRGSPNPKRERK